MDATVSDGLVGRLLDGRYRVESRIARGGMATVYTALDTRLDRTVAVKVMHPVFAGDEQFVARFIREAKSAARLSHPNVVAVYDQGADDGQVFLAMEYVRGRTLRELLRERGRLSAPQALQLLQPVLEALSAAHAAGLIHRDIKPENVLLADDGRVKVADFGLARATAARITTTGTTLIGTVAYLAPEQVTRGVADARTDVYAAGVMLFEMLTGHPPYDGDTPISVAYRHAHEDVPAPSTLVPGIPVSVDALVARATARDPDSRPADAGAFLGEVARVRRDLPAPAAPTAVSASQETLVVELPDRDIGASAAPAGPVGSANLVGAAAAEEPPRRRRHRRRGLIALLVVLLLAAGAGGGGWWYGYGRWATTPSLLNLDATHAQAKAKAAGLKLQVTSQKQYSETIPAGEVISQNPVYPHRLLRGRTVTVMLSRGKDRVAVPSFSTTPQLTAYQQVLQKAGLKIANPVQHEYSDTVPQGDVISIDPQPGTSVNPATATIIVTTSDGLPPITLPDVTNQSFTAAKQALQNLGFNVNETLAYSNTVKNGVVISQDPAPAAGHHAGDTINLTVSQGPQLFPVPDVRGMSVKQAEAALQAQNFKASVLGGHGVVLEQSPGPGTQERAGTTVTLIAGF